MEICKIELVNFLHDNNINFDDVDRKKRKKKRKNKKGLLSMIDTVDRNFNLEDYE